MNTLAFLGMGGTEIFLLVLFLLGVTALIRFTGTSRKVKRCAVDLFFGILVLVVVGAAVAQLRHQ